MKKPKEVEIVEPKEIVPLKTEVSKIIKVAEALEVKDKDGLQEATNLLTHIKSVGKDITFEKEKITKPLNETLKRIRGFFAPIEAQWSEAERIVKNKMLNYQKAELEKAEKVANQVEAKVEAGKMSFEKGAEKIEEATPEKSIKAEEGGGSASFKKIKKVEIIDEKLIPDEYWDLNLIKVRKVALAGVEIPGVKVVEELTVAGSTKI